jgi:6-pyruvoyltetrahydropterin/6-carboxytetrahydropterin synthase
MSTKKLPTPQAMRCEISQTFYFDAAHTLKRAIEADSSKRVHGHTYNAEVFVAGEPDPATGMVMDLGLVRREIEVLRELLDHHLLDDVKELGPPTLENLCQFIFRKLDARLPGLTSVRVWRVSLGDGCRVSR